MNDEPEPIILTDVQNPTLEISGDKNDDPGKDHFVIGFVLCGITILCIPIMSDFCCLVGFLTFVSGVGFLISANSKTYAWRKENEIKKWTTGEIFTVFLTGVLLFIILGMVFEFMMWY